MKPNLSICWFRQDLRLADNPALLAASKHGQTLPIFIHDIEDPRELAVGEASSWWLHYSLESLNRSLGGKLSIYRGNPLQIIENLVQRLSIEAVHWNRWCRR